MLGDSVLALPCFVCAPVGAKSLASNSTLLGCCGICVLACVQTAKCFGNSVHTNRSELNLRCRATTATFRAVSVCPTIRSEDPPFKNVVLVMAGGMRPAGSYGNWATVHLLNDPSDRTSVLHHRHSRNGRLLQSQAWLRMSGDVAGPAGLRHRCPRPARDSLPRRG